MHLRADQPATRPVLRAVLVFAASGMAAVAVLGYVAVMVLQRTGRGEAIRNAKTTTELAGNGIVAPALRPGILTGQRAAIAALDQVVRQRVLRPPVVRIKLWDANGRVLYSDEHRLIGQSYRETQGTQSVLRRGGVAAEVSDLRQPENYFERPHHKLLEVYLAIRGPDGRPLRFESYLRYSSVAASGQRLWSAFAPALLITLALLELVQIPLAWSLARRLQRTQREREELFTRAIDASERERRRIARDLHDGVVQSLAGVSYTLAAASEDLRADRPQVAGKMLDEAAMQTRTSMRELRTLLVDLYPPALERAGLGAALTDLVAPLSAEKIDVDLDVDPGLRLAPEQVPVLFRAAQEAVRNVQAHAGARHVRVAAERRDGRAVLSVQDDGRGFDAAKSSRPGSRPHFGLRMLEDLAREAEGTLTVESRPGEGTRLDLEIPL